MSKKKLGLVMIFVLLLLKIIFSQVPDPHNIKGRVYHSDGTTGVENGIPVRINDTNNGETVFFVIDAPLNPQQAGRYSTTIIGSDADPIVARAWNASHYGENASEVLDPKTTEIDIVIDTIRPAETNLIDITPSNNSLYNISDYFNVSASVIIIGGSDGSACYAAISFSQGILEFAPGFSSTNVLGDMPLGSTNTTYWTLKANQTGSANISLESHCVGELILEEANKGSIGNISVTDGVPPIITLISPFNETVLTAIGSLNISFLYNVTDASSLQSCSLIIDSNINETVTSVQKDLTQNISYNLTVGNYTWGINCTDAGNNVGSSSLYNLTLLANVAPTISNLQIASVIDLDPGTTTFISCNATVRDENNFTDITGVNATFYHSSSASDDAEDNNAHYSNASCSSYENDDYEGNFTCGFNLEYYTTNGTWHCNMTAVDSYNQTAFENISTFVTELLAVEITPGVIDYGSLQADMTSVDDVNMTMLNIGNIPLNMSVHGYADGQGDGLAMNCTIGTIPIGNEKYSVNPDDLFGSMTALTDTAAMINGYTLAGRTTDGGYDTDKNNTYWKLQMPAGIRGTCNGTVTFIAGKA